MSEKVETRTDVVLRAIEECLDEMYMKSQPSVSWKEVNQHIVDNIYGENVKDGYNFHYLSEAEFYEIKEKYLTIYNLKPHWHDHCNIIKEYLMNGGPTNEKINGFYQSVPSINEQLKDILATDPNVKETLETVFDMLQKCEDFYKFDIDERTFLSNISNYAPSSNKETVIDNWKKLGQDIEIKNKVEDPYSGELVFPETLDGWFEGAVFNYDLDEWVTPEDMKIWEENHDTRDFIAESYGDYQSND